MGGTLTIPAEQWLSLNVFDHIPDLTTVEDRRKSLDFTALTGIKSISLESPTSSDVNPTFCAWLIDSHGSLYIQNYWFHLTSQVYHYGVTLQGVGNLPNSFYRDGGIAINGASVPNYPSFRLAFGVTADAKISPFICLMDVTDSVASSYWTSTANFLNIINKEAFTGDVTDIVSGGILYMPTSSWGVGSYSNVPAKFQELFTSRSASKTVVGNTNLSKKILKLNSLSDTDTLSVTSADWLVNGESIADFLGAEFITESGSSATIDTPTEIEPMAFNVVVPASLPIYVDSQNTVFVADNAVISNYSCAPVAIKSVEITPKPNSGWQMVDSEPSPNRDGMEFTFATSLQGGEVLGVDENLSFTYEAKLSPYTVGTASLDLATVNVTVCWADEMTP